MKTFNHKLSVVLALISSVSLMLSSHLLAQPLTALYNFSATTLAVATNADGEFPLSTLIASGNVLYGTAAGGGAFGWGTVFAINTDGTGFRALHHFTKPTYDPVTVSMTNVDGAYPATELILDGDTLYGTTGYGGSGVGTVFCLSTGGTGFRTLHSFTNNSSTHGNWPRAGLVLSGTTLYGTTPGPGTVFALNTDGTGFRILHEFTGTDGSDPCSGLTFSGNVLYGTCFSGGNTSTGGGTVFTINTDGTGFNTLHNFALAEGSHPYGSLVVSGNTLYGTICQGDASGAGTVFKVNVDGTGFATLHTFTAKSDGGWPLARLTLTGTNLYGTTSMGGSSDRGTVFKLNTDGTDFATVHIFTTPLANGVPNDFGTNTDGAYPYGGLGLVGDMLYGTTYHGGSLGGGTVFAVLLHPQPQLDFTYLTNNGTITITGYTGPGGTAVIPGTVNGLPVTAIGYAAFQNCWSLTNVAIPNSVVSVGSFAFENCGLTSLIIPDSVTDIGNEAFEGCLDLKEVTIGNGLTNIGYGLFTICLGLTSVEIGNGVTSIGAGAFSMCGSLTNVTIPTSVTNIGNGAFDGCTSLTNISLDDNLISIGANAFWNCSSLKVVTIPAIVTSLGTSPFQWCSRLSAITVDALNPAYSSLDGVLFDKTQTTLIEYPGGKVSADFTIPNGVTRVDSYAFADCLGVTNLMTPDSLKSIGTYAFYGCGWLTNVTLGKSVANLELGAFDNCIKLTRVVCLGDAPRLDSDVFLGDDGATVYYLAGTTGWGLTFGGRPALLLNPQNQFAYATNNGTIAITGYTGPAGAVTIPLTIEGLPVTTIAYSAFLNRHDVAAVTIPDSVTNIGASAFAGCTSLTNITIPYSVTRIGDSAFAYCGSLTNVSLSHSVTSIASGTFQHCTNLALITIVNTVTNIGDAAFADCASLTAIYFQGNSPSIGSDVFYHDDNAKVYYLPSATGWDSTCGGLPTVVWSPAILAFQPGFEYYGPYGPSSRAFSFNIAGFPDLLIVVEASTNLLNPYWLPLQTNILANGAAHFSDPGQTNYPARFYRVRLP